MTNARKGNATNHRINLFDEKLFPKIADLVRDLSDTERKAVEEIVLKDPKENWQDVAKRVGVSERQLRNIRQKNEVQEAVYKVSKELFKTEVPDVLKVLTAKAKKGEAWAVKLFLEVSGELKEKAVSPTDIRLYSNVPRPDYDLKAAAERALKDLTTDELQDELLANLRLSAVRAKE